MLSWVDTRCSSPARFAAIWINLPEDKPTEMERPDPPSPDVSVLWDVLV